MATKTAQEKVIPRQTLSRGYCGTAYSLPPLRRHPVGERARLELLPRRSEQNLVYIDLFRLAHSEQYHIGEGLRGYSILRIEVADALSDGRRGDAVWEFSCDRTRRDDRRADIVGFDLLP